MLVLFKKEVFKGEKNNEVRKVFKNKTFQQKFSKSKDVHSGFVSNYCSLFCCNDSKLYKWRHELIYLLCSIHCFNDAFRE